MPQQYAASSWENWIRGVQRGVTTLKRQRSWTVVLGALVGVFLLLDIVALALLSLQGTGTVLNQTDVRVELEDTASNQQIQQLISELRSAQYVGNITYVTKEQAYDRMRTADPELITSLEASNISNPFPATLLITLTSVQNYNALVAALRDDRLTGVVNADSLRSSESTAPQLGELTNLTSAAGALTALFLVLTAIVLLFTISELVRGRAYGRAEEIRLEQLSGAQTSSILIPFVTEASLILFAAILLSTLIIAAVLFGLPYAAPALMVNGSLGVLREAILNLLSTTAPLLLLLEILLVPVIAGVGTWLAVTPRLNRSLLFR